MTREEKVIEKGISKAVNHAERKSPPWEQRAYKFLVNYIVDHKKFMVEDVREAAKGVVPEPPSARAWGGVIRKAMRNGIVENIGYGRKKSKGSNSTLAVIWQVKYD